MGRDRRVADREVGRALGADRVVVAAEVAGRAVLADARLVVAEDGDAVAAVCGLVLPFG